MKKLLFLLIPLFLCAGSKTKNITWLALGDSITYLNDHQNETGNRLTKGYLSLVTEQFPEVEYINQGHNGWTATGIAEKIESLGLVKADVYTVFLGTNDWWAGKPVGTIQDYLNNTGTGTSSGAFRIIIDKLKSLNKKAQIILITPLQRGDFVYINNYKNNAFGSYKAKNEQELEQFAHAILEIGKHEKLAVVDLYHQSGITPQNAVHFKRLKNRETNQYQNYTYPEYTEIPFNLELDEYPYPKEAIHMTYDGLHPSDKGNEIIADMLIKKWKGL